MKAAILAGEPVTADELARATAADELARLQAEAERLAAERRAEAERRDQIRRVRAEVLAAEQRVDDAGDIAAITEAAARIISRHRRLAEVVRAARVKLARLGVQEGEEVEGVRWRDAWWGRADSIQIGDRTLTVTAYPGQPIALALLAACEQAGVNKHLLRPHIDITHSRPRTREEMAAAERRSEQARQAALARIVERQQETEQESANG